MWEPDMCVFMYAVINILLPPFHVKLFLFKYVILVEKRRIPCQSILI
jgi:hypothetical protein